MATTATSTATPARGRGAVAAHGDEALLDLVAGVARAAVADHEAHVHIAGRISMRRFNGAKVAFDLARGIGDPHRDPQRTPTANAIVMRFNAQAPRSIRWDEIVAASLRQDRTMWLVAARREEAAGAVSDHQLVFALRFVADRLGVDALGRGQYSFARDRLVAEDTARHGGEGLLTSLVPTLNQIESRWRWGAATKLAGLKDADARKKPRLTGGGRQMGMPSDEAAAYYAALNAVWPSSMTLTAWARDTGFALSTRQFNPWKPVITRAAKLLAAAGIEPPSGGPKGLGAGEHVKYRYPVNGIPGAPPRDGRGTPERNAVHEEFCVLALRVWLASLASKDSVSRSRYLSWQVGSGWPAPRHFDRHGGFKLLRERARRDNDTCRREHRTPMTKKDRERVELLRDRIRGTGARPDDVPFETALAAVLAGPHAVGPTS